MNAYAINRRRDKLIKEERHDAYREREKHPQNTQCTICKAVVVKGRWMWKDLEEISSEVICPACRRIKDHYPAGIIEIKGEYTEHHLDEIINMMHNIEKNEKNNHPLERIMDIKQQPGNLTVTTTGIHIARWIGNALLRAFHGDLEYHYEDNDKSIRVTWERQA